MDLLAYITLRCGDTRSTDDNNTQELCLSLVFDFVLLPNVILILMSSNDLTSTILVPTRSIESQFHVKEAVVYLSTHMHL